MNKIMITAALMLTIAGCKSQQSEPVPVESAAAAKPQGIKVAAKPAPTPTLAPTPAPAAAQPTETEANQEKADKEGAKAEPAGKEDPTANKEMAKEDPMAKKAAEPAGESPAKEAAAAKDIAKIEVAALSSLISEKKPVVVFDANTDETRKKEGVIPGAKLLTNVKDYPVSELPKNKDEKLVFYCYNESCPASHSAADKAIISGYTDVNILPSGIMGWKKAGNKTQTIQ